MPALALSHNFFRSNPIQQLSNDAHYCDSKYLVDDHGPGPQYCELLTLIF